MDQQVEKLLQAERAMNEKVRKAQNDRNARMEEIEANVKGQVADLQRRLKAETVEKIDKVRWILYQDKRAHHDWANISSILH